jgi:HEPN domain-containing protein
MKTSLSHLPENKQHEIHRIAEIIREVVNPEKIILFGSYAKGGWVEDRYTDKHGILHEYISDYDFLVVTNGNSEKTYIQEHTIMDRVDRYHPPVNLEIHEIEFVNEGLEWGQYFFTDIISEGILLFDTGNIQFSTSRILTSEELKQKMNEHFQTWYGSASRFLRISETAYKDAVERGEKLNEVVFNLHQAAESLYYAVLLVFCGYKPKTHNLWKLRKKTKSHSKELFAVFRAETDREEEGLFDLLKRSYIEARYKSDYQINAKELGVLIERVKQMNAVANDMCVNKINT